MRPLLHRLPSVFLSLAALGLLAGPTACSSHAAGGSDSSDSPDKSPSDSEGTTEIDPNDPANQPPHALGTIILGETHSSESGSVGWFMVTGILRGM